MSILAPVIRSLPQRDAVALTFDDGPHAEFTPRILDILAEQGVSATFFVIGRFAREHPDLLKRMVAERHTIGNHSLDHDRFGVNQRKDYWLRQISETQKIVADITGQPPVLFRPPMGFKTAHIAAAAREQRLPIIGWSVRSLDTRKTTSVRLRQRVVRAVGGHDIVLLHDGVESARAGGSQQHTVEALAGIVEGIVAKELRVASLLESLLSPARASALRRRGQHDESSTGTSKVDAPSSHRARCRADELHLFNALARRDFLSGAVRAVPHCCQLHVRSATEDRAATGAMDISESRSALLLASRPFTAD